MGCAEQKSLRSSGLADHSSHVIAVIESRHFVLVSRRVSRVRSIFASLCLEGCRSQSRALEMNMGLELNQCRQPCSFRANLGLFFSEIAGFFEDFGVAHFWACFICNLLVSGLDCSGVCFAHCLFSKLHGTFPVSFHCKTKLGRVFM